MRKLNSLLAVTAVFGMAALPQTSSADAVRPDTRAEDFSYYGGGYYPYDDYYAGPYYPAPYYDDGYYYPPAYHARPFPVPVPVPFVGLGLGFGFGHGHWGGDD